jgi:hypothetical protein
MSTAAATGLGLAVGFAALAQSQPQTKQPEAKQSDTQAQARPGSAGSGTGAGMMGQGMGYGMGPGMMGHGMGYGMGPGMMGHGMGYGMGPGMMGPGMGYGMGPGMMGMGGMAGPHLEGRLAYLRAELGITDAQRSAWDAYAAAVKKTMEGMQGMHQSMMQAMASGTPVERVAARVSAMESRIASLKELQPALASLYGTLTAEQKQKADQLLGMPF